MSLVPLSDAQKYSKSPSQTTIEGVSKLHQEIRSALGDAYETFLQGSYKNDTSIRDLNDVDIVALKRSVVSSVFSNERFDNIVTWQSIFDDVQNRIESISKFRGKSQRGDKCIIVKADWNADVVPAVRVGNANQDPIAIYSFKEGSERQNFPRVHYENGVAKQKSTNGSFKPTVRMFKNWAERQWPKGGVAPSFYIECLVSNVPDLQFHADMVDSFFYVGYWIESNILPSKPPYVYSVARDKDILVESEWRTNQYSVFHERLVRCTSLALAAIKATTQYEAIRYWKAAFNE